MNGDLRPEDVLKSLEKGQLAPFYLFYGPGEFRSEKVLDKIRALFIPESARDFNLEILYGGEVDPADIISRAQTLPFLAQNRPVASADIHQRDQLPYRIGPNVFVVRLLRLVDINAPGCPWVDP